MWVVFRVQGVSNVIERVELMADSSGKEEQKKEFKQRDDKALLIIHQCVDDTHFEKIQNAIQPGKHGTFWFFVTLEGKRSRKSGYRP